MSEYALALSEAEVARYQWMAEAALRMEGDLWEAAGVAGGAAVADVGCGPGAVAVVLARLVGPGGRVVAVDRDPGAVAAAREAASRAGAANVTVAVGDADRTGIDPASADVVMIRHVLAHNGGREEAIVRHAAGVVRPGGCVYLADVDATGMRVRPPDADLDDLNERYRLWHERRGNDLSVGLRLRDLLAASGLEVAGFHGRYQIVDPPPGLRPPSWAAREALVADGLATAGDVARWAAALDRLEQDGRPPTVFMPLFFAIGRRPG